MNKMFAKQGLRSLVTLFFVFGAMFFAATTASAQTTTVSSQAPAPAQSLMDANNAVTTLKAQIQLKHAQIPNLSGTSLTMETMRVQYYKAMVVAIGNGESVSEALTSTLMSALPQGTTSSPAPGIMNTLNQIYQEAVGLLSI